MFRNFALYGTKDIVLRDFVLVELNVFYNVMLNHINP